MKPTAASFIVCGVVLLALLLPLPGQGQGSSQDQQGGLPTIRNNVNLVNVFFTVNDHHGALLANLNKDEFEVLENGKPQTIKYFSAMSDLPLTLGLLVDTSSGAQGTLHAEKAAAADFLRQIITDKGSIFVASFDSSEDGATLEQGFTTNIQRMRRAVEGIIPEGRGSSGARLFDAIYVISHEMLGEQVGRKVMVILTDGEDVGSRLKLRDALEAAQKADAICYVLLLVDPQHLSNMGDMRQLAEQTGGRVIEINRPDKIGDAFRQISAELRSQYSLGYSSEDARRDGSFRKIEVQSKNGYKVQARKGYYAPAS
ncbi:MAG TPA: VWA domain-containing protein [Candidatus Acidoferrales bacterium]|nr:VWA domain-containing protein [Candidatus Acidoferrales bacterium]